MTEPPRDELFGLTFRRALKVYRRVEYLEEYTETEWPKPSDDNEAVARGPIDIIKQQWVEVRNVGQEIRVSLDQDNCDDMDGIFDVS